MRKYTTYQTILYSRAMYLFRKQVHRTICVNLTAKCEQKTRYFLCLFDETDYCRDSCNRVKGRQSQSLLNVFVRSKRLQFLQLLIETKCSIRWIHSYQSSTLRLIANRIVSYIEKVQANYFKIYGQIKMRIVLWADCLGRRILIHFPFNLVVVNTGLQQRRQRQQRELLKQQIRFNKQKNNSTRAVTFFSTFFFVTARARCEILLCVDLRQTTNFPFSYLTSISRISIPGKFSYIFTF